MARPGRGRALSLVNGLSVARIAATPVVVALVLAQQAAAATGVFAAAAVTDLLDGYLARRRGETSVLGTFLDTTADKVLVSGALIALVAVGAASAWAALVIVGRELTIMGLRGVVAVQGTVLKPSRGGKAKAAAQFAAIALALAYPGRAADWALAVAAALTAATGIDYLVKVSAASRGGRRA